MECETPARLSNRTAVFPRTRFCLCRAVACAVECCDGLTVECACFYFRTRTEHRILRIPGAGFDVGHGKCRVQKEETCRILSEVTSLTPSPARGDHVHSVQESDSDAQVCP